MIRLTCCQLCLGKVFRTQSVLTNSPVQFLRWKSASSNASPRPVPRHEDSLPEVEEFNNSAKYNEAPAPEATPHTYISRFKEYATRKQVNADDNLPLPTATVTYYPATVAETVQSVKHQKPLQLINAVSPNVLNKALTLSTKDLLKCYLGLSKSRLTGLVVITAMAGYALAPAPFAIDSFASLTLGTALTSASANTVNQIVEVPYDSQMDRTKNRVLVKEILTKEHAAAFAVMTGVSGLALLSVGANGLTAALGGLNLMLYTCVYTPMKRQSIANTWVGSVVGGIPPLMGWAACTGEITHGALLLGGILYAWQFPHFNALSWNIRHDYNKAGYKMMAISHPELCRKTSLRYSLGLILISSLAPVCNVTSWTFVIDSLPLNGYLVYLAYKFYRDGDSASSRKLFRFTLIHLPVLILLMMVSKQAYKEKSECPVSAIINEATAAALVPPPSPPIVFANSVNETNAVKIDKIVDNNHRLGIMTVHPVSTQTSDVSTTTRTI